MLFISWWVNASFAVHPDYKGYTGRTMSLGKGSMVDICQKQKFNTHSSTEAELVSVDDCVGRMEWTMWFLQAQGYDTTTELHQDNMSTIRIGINGKKSSSQGTRHLNIKYSYITDIITQGWLTVKYCPTDKMLAEFFTKLLTGAQFKKVRAHIMNCPEDLPSEHLKSMQL